MPANRQSQRFPTDPRRQRTAPSPSGFSRGFRQTDIRMALGHSSHSLTMAISATTSRYDTILLHRQKQSDAAQMREARSEARRKISEQTMSKSALVRNSMSNFIAQNGVNQSQLTAQLIRSRMVVEAAEKAAPSKWYR